jgi:hypothetical protein
VVAAQAGTDGAPASTHRPTARTGRGIQSCHYAPAAHIRLENIFASGNWLNRMTVPGWPTSQSLAARSGRLTLPPGLLTSRRRISAFERGAGLSRHRQSGRRSRRGACATSGSAGKKAAAHRWHWRCIYEPFAGAAVVWRPADISSANVAGRLTVSAASVVPTRPVGLIDEFYLHCYDAGHAVQHQRRPCRSIQRCERLLAAAWCPFRKARVTTPRPERHSEAAQRLKASRRGITHFPAKRRLCVRWRKISLQSF